MPSSVGPEAPNAPLTLRHRPAGASRVCVRIYEKGNSRAKLAINVPVALADLVFKSLPDDAIADLRREGYDAGTFWERLKRTGPAEILTIEGENGERIQVWIE